MAVEIETFVRGLYLPEMMEQREAEKDRVVIVGFGHIGPLGRYGTLPDGTKITEAWDNLLNGVNGIRPIPHHLFPEFRDFPNVETKLLGYVDHDDDGLDEMLEDELGSVSDLAFKSRSTKLAEIATKLALHDIRSGSEGGYTLMQEYTLNRGIRQMTSYRVDPTIAEEMAVIGGTGMGGASDEIVDAQRELERTVVTGEKIDPVYVFRALPGASEESATMDNQIYGESFGVLAECATGGEAAGILKRLIQNGDVIAGVAVTTESTIKRPVGVMLFDALGALTKGSDPEQFPHSCDEENDGFCFAEAGTAVGLMREDIARLLGLRTYGVFSGFDATSDAYHPSYPREDGKYQKRAMVRNIIKSGGFPKGEQMYIRMHATGTKPPGGVSADVIESRVTREAIDEELERRGEKRTYEDVVAGASSMKPLTGHMLGADGLAGMMFSALAIKSGELPGLWKSVRLLPESQRLNMVVNGSRKVQVVKAMSNSFGFGGENNSLMVEDENLKPYVRGH